MRALLLLILLAGAAGGIWSHLLRREQLINDPMSCPASAAQTLISAEALDSIALIAPGSAEVGVLNATDRRGLAAQVATNLKTYGFTRAQSAGNDLLHPPGTMRCAAQLRFGRGGAPAARTLALVLPCAQLVDDQRPDNTVDLVLGSAFSTPAPNDAARTVLQQLDDSAVNEAQPQGGLQSIAGPATPVVLPSLLAAARPTHC